MKLSRTVTYALKATLQLAQNTKGGPVPCSRLAAQGGMPERFLLQILRSLVTHGILKSTRGVDGGYVLLREPEDVSLLDVIEAIEGPLTHEIAIGEGLPESSSQKLSDVLVEVTQATLSKLSSVKLADLICPPEEFAAMLSQRDQDPSTGGMRTRIDEPSSVPQTPKATPEINPAPAATPNMSSPAVPPPAMPSNPIPPAHSPAPHVGSTNSIPTVNPNSGASL